MQLRNHTWLGKQNKLAYKIKNNAKTLCMSMKQQYFGADLCHLVVY